MDAREMKFDVDYVVKVDGAPFNKGTIVRRKLDGDDDDDDDDYEYENGYQHGKNRTIWETHKKFNSDHCTIIQINHNKTN